MFLGISSCVSVAPPTAALPESSPPKIHDSGELVKNLTQRLDRFRSVRALGSVQYWGPDGRGGFQEVIVVQRPDRLRLETLSQLGAILIVTVDGSEIAGFHPREGLFYRGRSSKENLLRYTQIPLELADVTSLLLGLPPVEIQAAWQEDGNSLVWSWNGRGKDVVTFDSQAVPAKWERFDSAGEIEMSAQFADYVPTPAGLFPLRISVEAHAQGKRLEIRYQQPELNVSLPLALFMQQKPANAREIPLESLGG